MKDVLKTKIPSFSTRLEWALFLRKVGFTIMPIRPGTKQAAHAWSEWVGDQSVERIRTYWLNNPNSDIAIYAEGLFIADCDRPEAKDALNGIKERHGIRPSIIVKTRKGQHEYFALPSGVTAKQVGHDSEKYPHRIDVRTGKSYIIAPGSTDKQVVFWRMDQVVDITPVTQAFVDEIDRHNGVTKPTSVCGSTVKSVPLGDAAVPRIKELLEYISPDVGHSDWVRVGMAIYRETEGSDAGLDLFDTWSKQGLKYKGMQDILTRWRSFNKEVRNPVTMGTLMHMARAAGAPVGREAAENKAWFEMAEAEAPHQPRDIAKKEVENQPSEHASIDVGESLSEVTTQPDSLTQRSLIHYLPQLEKQVQKQRAFLGNLALLGQSTVIYAAPNSGKTLLTLTLAIESVKSGDVSADNIHIFNADDSGSGLLEKSSLCASHGINMYGDGYNGFRVEDLRSVMQQMIDSHQTKGQVLVLDTLTRFFDTNNKKQARAFTKLVRTFTAQGGTFIGLAHTRKNPGLDGQAVYGGTSDVLNDFDCAYMLLVVSPDAGGERKTVEFRNIKRRGDVRLKAAYSYSNKAIQSYVDLVQSVKTADSAEVAALEKLDQAKRDSKIVAVIQSHIRRGICKKMELCKAVAVAAGVSRAKAESVLATYTGTVPETHYWNYSVGAKGANLYELLPEHASSSPVSQVPSSPAPRPDQGQGQPDSFMPYPDESDPQSVDADSSELEDVRF